MDNEIEHIGIKAPKGTKARIQDHIGYGRRYRDLTEFVLAAIEEKLDPTKRDEIIRQELIDLKRRDPVFFQTLLK